MTTNELIEINKELTQNNRCLLVDNHDGTGYAIIASNSDIPMIYELVEDSVTETGWTFKGKESWSFDNILATGHTNYETEELYHQLSEDIDNGAQVIAQDEEWWYGLI